MQLQNKQKNLGKMFCIFILLWSYYYVKLLAVHKIFILPKTLFKAEVFLVPYSNKVNLGRN